MTKISLQSCAAEFIGTFLLVFAVGCNVLTENATWGGVSIAFTLMVNIYALGDASGANFNPAVSVALGLAKQMQESWKQVGVYCAVQVLGACTAALCYGVLFQGGFQLIPADGKVVGVILCELCYTFMLCFVVLNVVASRKLDQNQFYGLAIGFVILAGAYGSAPLGAGCFNPAVAIGITASGLFGGSAWCLLYMAVELAGAYIAVQAFWLVRPEEKDGSPVPAKPTLKSKLIGEAIGTFMLVLTVGLNVLGSSKAGAFSIAASLACMIYSIGDISGGHFNPAVTTAIYFCGNDVISRKEAVQYMSSQFAGGILAAITYATAHSGGSFALGPNSGWSWGGVMSAEFIFTFVLSLVVLCLAMPRTDKTDLSEVLGFAIASCVTVGGFAVGSISGGSLNPAVSIGIAVADVLGGGLFYKGFLYVGAELLGGAAAAYFYKMVYGSFDLSLIAQTGKAADPEAEAVAA